MLRGAAGRSNVQPAATTPRLPHPLRRGPAGLRQAKSVLLLRIFLSSFFNDFRCSAQPVAHLLLVTHRDAVRVTIMWLLLQLQSCAAHGWAPRYRHCPVRLTVAPSTEASAAAGLAAVTAAQPGWVLLLREAAQGASAPLLPPHCPPSVRCRWQRALVRQPTL